MGTTRLRRMLRVLPLLSLTLALTAWAGPPRFVAPGLRVTNLKASLARDFTDHLAQQLASRGLSVITNSDVQALLGLERQKQLLGCSDQSTSCMAELAGALGADGVVLGTVVRVGRKYQVNVRIIDATSAQPLALYSGQCDQEEALFDELDLAAHALINELQPYLAARAKRERAAVAPDGPAPVPPVEPAVVAQTRPGARRWWWLPAAGAGAFAIASGVFFAGAGAARGQLASTGAPGDFALSATVARGQTFEALAWTGAALAAASLATMAALLLFGEDDVALTLAPRVDGAALVLGGAW